MLYIISLVLTTGSLYLFTAFIHLPSPNSPPDNHKSFSVYLVFFWNIKTYNTVLVPVIQQSDVVFYTFSNEHNVSWYITIQRCYIVVACYSYTAHFTPWVIYFATKYLYLLNLPHISFLLWSLCGNQPFLICCVNFLDST